MEAPRFLGVLAGLLREVRADLLRGVLAGLLQEVRAGLLQEVRRVMSDSGQTQNYCSCIKDELNYF